MRQIELLWAVRDERDALTQLRLRIECAFRGHSPEKREITLPLRKRTEPHQWASMLDAPKLTDERPFEAYHPDLGVCVVQWRGMTAKVTPPNGVAVFYLHAKGNRHGYPCLEDTFFQWRTI